MERFYDFFMVLLEILITLFLVYALIFDDDKIINERYILFFLWIKIELYIKYRTKDIFKK